ncbi:hypothetical protein L6164_025649 [Bauhinia variegata]|uniref:Uncharacterized protein n=1 Tax=Bauhinia variegata TaxID=167791 RepID=A0ACB9M1I9_BAUVA|nr:hypothetical protein L6164_025649 [Bauhinia variegata]
MVDTTTSLVLSLTLFLSFLFSNAQMRPGSIEPGFSIAAGTNLSLHSPSGDFAFGFHKLVTGHFLVGIWFDKIPQKTLVWSANRDDPASSINITLSGQFVLHHANGSSFSIYNGTDTDSAFMQDDGNFILRNSTSGIIWQSFDSPTDTILLGQSMKMNHKLYSNASGTDYSTGQYKLEVQNDGNIVTSAFRFEGDGYWFTATVGNKDVRLVFDNVTAFLYASNGTQIIRSMTSTENITSAVAIKDYYHRAIMNFQGNFQQLIHHKNGSEWSIVWQSINDHPCKVNAICGPYGFCTSPNNIMVNCSCLPGYVPLDPNIPSKGCHPSRLMDFCAANSSSSDFTVERLEDADIPNRNFAELKVKHPSTEESCMEELMNDCFCAAAVFNDSKCHKKRLPLLNGRRSIPDTSNSAALIKVPLDHKDDGNESWVVLLVALLSCSLLAVVFAATAIYHHPLFQGWISKVPPPKPKAVDINLKRPSMKKVTEMLEGNLEMDLPPLMPWQFN